MAQTVPLYGFGGGGGSGGTLTVTAPPGVTVMVSKDGKSKTMVSGTDGIAVFKGLESGTWTLTITDGSQTASKFFSRVFPGKNIFQTGEGGEYHIKMLPSQRVNTGLLTGKPLLGPKQKRQHHSALHILLFIVYGLAHRLGQRIQSAFLRKLRLYLLSPFISLCRSIFPQPGGHPDSQLSPGHAAVGDTVQLPRAQQRHLMPQLGQIFGKHIGAHCGNCCIRRKKWQL